MSWPVFLAVAICYLAPAWALDPARDFSGTWTLDAAVSDFHALPDRPASRNEAESWIVYPTMGTALQCSGPMRSTEARASPASNGFRTFRVLELALYPSLGKLPEPELTHEFF